ncbi:MAG: hypothetical protein K2K14_00795 [Ruminococcus sp.]|nr:hypothetical protein [Ruminococcus sp.]
MLAYYYYPFSDNHNLMEYTKNDLMNPSKVEELFDYCQILEAYITKSGWKFLINYYGYEKLYEIDIKSGWFDAETLDEYILYVQSDMDNSSE